LKNHCAAHNLRAKKALCPSSLRVEFASGVQAQKLVPKKGTNQQLPLGSSVERGERRTAPDV
jgi:hypothetical protein